MSKYWTLEHPTLGFYIGLRFGRPQFERVPLRRDPKVVKYETQAAAFKEQLLIKRTHYPVKVMGPFLGPDDP